MPLTVNENYIGQLWTMAEVSRQNTGGGEGVEILKNDFFSVPSNLAELTKYLPDYDLDDPQSEQKSKKLHSSKSLGALSKFLKRDSTSGQGTGDSKDDSYNNNNNNNNNINDSHKLSKHTNNISDSNSEVNIYSSLPNSMSSADNLTTKFDKTHINGNDSNEASSRSRNGQYTYKIYKIASKFPWFIRKILPKESTILHEKSWNLYPVIKTHIRNEYMKEKFHVFINTITKECLNGVIEDNVHNLTPEQLEKREIVIIDITEAVSSNEYLADEDPTKYYSAKGKRGPLKESWIGEQRPMICCYKLIDLEFVWFALQSKAENYMVNMYKKLFKKFHRQVFCWMDKWYDLSLEDVRKFESDVQRSLSERINKGEIAANPFEVAEQ